MQTREVDEIEADETKKEKVFLSWVNCCERLFPSYHERRRFQLQQLNAMSLLTEKGLMKKLVKKFLVSRDQEGA